jgi:nickel-dependent lactate racemase
MPGMGGIETVLGNHDARMIGNPKATWGITGGNPIWEEVHEVAAKLDRKFLCNVTLNKDKEITGIFAGDLAAAHTEGCAFVKGLAMVEVANEFDIVISTNSGYPLDLNLYQAVKGMRAAEKIVREGGAIIMAVDCWDGIPEHGLYGQLLREANSPQQLLEMINSPGFLKPDQWQAQIQALIQLRADVYLHTHNLSEVQIRECLLNPCEDIRETVDRLITKYGSDTKICVLPEGPQTIPYVREEILAP